MNRVAVLVIMLMLVTGLWSGLVKAVEVPPADFYVATNGSDEWSGKFADPTPEKTDGPFRSMERARDEIRKLKAAGLAADKTFTIVIRGGKYSFKQSFTLDSRDSGSLHFPTRYIACPGDKVILAGGPSILPDAFHPVTDASILERLDPTARAKILQADLRTLSITSLESFPVKFQGTSTQPELFFNNKRMTLARWPNEGWATIAKIIDSGACPREGDPKTNGGVFEYSGNRPSGWDVETGVWLHGYWCFDWFSETIQIKTLDSQNHRITLAAPSLYSIRQGNPSPRRYYALNLLEELDSPGEYYIDCAGSLLYFWPPEPLGNARMTLSTLKAPIVAVQDATDIILRGFIIEASLKNGIEVSGGSRVFIQACEICNTRELGISVSGGTAHKVEACDIHDTGTGGIILSGGNRKALTPAGHEAVNNHIWRFSIHKPTSSYAVQFQGVGNRAAHNLIHDAPHQAIFIGGNDHIFEYNIVHDVCMETDDCGACYKGRNPSCRGNIIRYNYWHDIGSPMGHGNAAVYFDDGDGGDLVLGNVFFRCGEPGRGSFGTVFSHGGHNNLAENNIFIECKRALGSAPWSDQRWKNAINGGEDCFWNVKLLEEVDITKPPYTEHYPGLVGFMDPQPGQDRVNRAVNNVFVNCTDIKSGNWQVNFDNNWRTDHDPGFINMAENNFRLKPDSEVFSNLPAFEPIPFDNIGLQQNELRPTLNP
ncbi:MAG: right-handed parallel beta-helix repeat-containing protein [Sedimentisphaerales bacterium]|nr:right-handed parallel beta-helix repeat-containing protein [Sedimentisphaerales bacterium]